MIAGREVAETTAEPEKSAIQSVERVSQILSLFDQATPRLSVAMVSERVGLNRTTAHRYLLSLQSSGFLDRTNAPGPVLDQLSTVISARKKVLAFAPGIMRELSDATRMTVALSILGRTGPIIALVEEAAAGAAFVSVRTGSILTASSAQSRVLVAFQSDQSAIERHLSNLSDAAARAESQELARVRKQRLARAEVAGTGLAAIAAPVFGGSDVEAAIAVLGTSAAVPPLEQPSPVSDAVRTAAARLSTMVGG